MTSYIQHRLLRGLVILAFTLLSGCAVTSPTAAPHPEIERQRITELDRDILSLGDQVDASEARRAARISIQYSLQLAREYEISGNSPVMHNFLVNIGVKPRGLCVDWTSDLLTRLRQERFHSLDLHWGIANYESAFRLEHSTVIVSARGESMYKGIVLDPWRYSGQLFWVPTLEDPEYQWKPQAEIHALKREHEDANENRHYIR